MRIEGILPGQILNPENITDLLSKLNIGDVVRAQVLELDTNEILLKLFDGTVFTASTMVNIDARKGDFIELVVNNKNDGQIFLETVKSNNIKFSSGEDDIKKALIALNIKPDENNIEIAGEIKLNNLPMNRDIFTRVSDLISKFENMTADKAVFLVSNKLEINDQNISSIMRLANGEFKISSKLESFTNFLEEIDEPEFFKSVAEQMTNRESAEPAVQLKTTQLKTDTVSNKGAVITKDTPPNNTLKVSSNNADILQSIKIPEGFKIDEKLSAFNRISTNTPGSIEKNAEAYLKTEFTGFEKLPEDQKKLMVDIFTNFASKAKNFLKTSETDQFIAYSLKTGIPAKEDNYKPVVIKAFEKAFLKPETGELKLDSKVKDLFKDMYKNLDAVTKSADTLSASVREQVSNMADNIRNDLKFINDLNNFSSYVQIPLNIMSRDTTMELYILKKKSKNKKIDPENTVMFVSLDTCNLGRIESLISIKKKNISINMGVEDNKIIEFLKENYKLLYQSLQNKGYKLADIKYRLIEEKVNAVNVEHFKGKLLNENVSFDYRI